MVQLTYRTNEELCIVAWTGVLTWLPQSHLLPVLNDLMTNTAITGVFLGLDVLVVVVSQFLYASGYAKTCARSYPSEKSAAARVGHYLATMTLLELLRLVLSVTLPMLGVMLMMTPAFEEIVLVVKKFILLEEKMWRRWCPESYILLLSTCLILFVVRRSAFTMKVRRHYRRKKQSRPHFSH